MFSGIQSPRQAATQLLNFGLILSTAFMMWKGLSVVTASPTPVFVVLSGSMEPAIQRGDLILLWNNPPPIHVGSIVVYEVKDRPIPIVHRIVQKFHIGNETKLLTKGDNNAADDTGLYAKGQEHIGPEDILGGVVAYVPFIGYITILLSEYPWLKPTMLGLMGLFAALQRP